MKILALQNYTDSKINGSETCVLRDGDLKKITNGRIETGDIYEVSEERGEQITKTTYQEKQLATKIENTTILKAVEILEEILKIPEDELETEIIDNEETTEESKEDEIVDEVFDEVIDEIKEDSEEIIDNEETTEESKEDEIVDEVFDEVIDEIKEDSEEIIDNEETTEEVTTENTLSKPAKRKSKKGKK